MPSNRHNLVLDEQAFQGLLSAAFIVQEYNDRLNGRPRPARPQPAEPEVHPVPESSSACRHCGAPKLAGKSRCESCGRDEFRPGERLQRNWASMWLMSQEQDLWPARSPEIRESARKDAPPLAVGRSLSNPALDCASTGLVAPPMATEVYGQRKTDSISDTINDHLVGQSAPDKSEPVEATPGAAALERTLERTPEQTMDRLTIDQPTMDHPTIDHRAFDPELDDQVLTHSASEAFNPDVHKASAATVDTAMDKTPHRLTPEEERTHEDADLAVHTFRFSANDDSLAIEAPADELDALAVDASDSSDSSHPDNRSGRRSWADLREALHFHRSTLYLAGAILVAALALLWPTADPPRRAALGPWERTLVMLGLAEAPEPVVHSQGDPALQVWVDPHSALYYCPGEEQYGKTTDGRFTSQHEAQMDRFEPASRLACE